MGRESNFMEKQRWIAQEQSKAAKIKNMPRGEKFTPRQENIEAEQAQIEEDIFDPNVLNEKLEQMKKEGASEADVEAVSAMMANLKEKFEEAELTREERGYIRKMINKVGKFVADTLRRSKCSLDPKNKKNVYILAAGLYSAVLFGGATAGVIGLSEALGYHQAQAAEGEQEVKELLIPKGDRTTVWGLFQTPEPGKYKGTIEVRITTEKEELQDGCLEGTVPTGVTVMEGGGLTTKVNTAFYATGLSHRIDYLFPSKWNVIDVAAESNIFRIPGLKPIKGEYLFSFIVDTRFISDDELENIRQTLSSAKKPSAKKPNVESLDQYFQNLLPKFHISVIEEDEDRIYRRYIRITSKSMDVEAAGKKPVVWGAIKTSK